MATMPGLRPLGFGEILDVGIKLCLRNWRVLALCVVGLVLPVQVVSALVLLSVSPEALDPTAPQPSGGDELERFFIAQGVVVLLQMASYVIAIAACFKAVADAYLGTPPAAGRSLRFGARRLPKLLALFAAILLIFALVAGAVAGVAAAFGPVPAVLLALALLVPWFWLSISWSLAMPAVLFEGAWPPTALRRSFRLVRGRWWSILGIIFVGTLLVSLLAGMIQAILVIVPALLASGNEVALAFATVVAGTVGSAITTPFTAAIFALPYFDQRVRKEGFDLELLAQGLGEQTPAAPSPALLPSTPELTPEQRAAAPFWPPPPGWTPPPASGAPQPEPEAAPPPPGGWQPPTPPRWPPEPPERGPGGT